MRRKLAALLAGAMVLTSLPMVSFAASTNRVSRVPVIAKDQTIGEVGGSYLTIEEKEYLKDEIKAGEYFNLILKNGKWTEKVSKEPTLYNHEGEEAENQNVNFGDLDGFTMKKLTDTKVQIQVYRTPTIGKDFAFAIPLDNVKCTEEADVELTIDDYDSGVSKGTYVIAEFAKDATKAKIDSKSFNNVLDLNTLEIEELKIGTLKDGELRLEILNDDFAWIWNSGVAREVTVKGDGTLSNAKIKAVIDDVKSSNSVLVLEIIEIDEDEEEEEGEVETRKQRATLYISGLQIIAKRNADFGEVEVEIDGSHGEGCGVTKEVLKVGEYVDFGIKVSVAEEKDLVAGYDKQTYKITLEEVVQGSWASERRTTIKFPDYVRIVDKSAVKIIDADCENIGERREKYLYVDDDDNVVKSKYAYMECDDHWIDFANIKKEDSTKTTKLVFEVTLEAKAASSGDITATFEGNALLGYEEELVLGEVTVPFTVDVEAKELKAGLKVQDAGTITVTETDKGKLTKGTKLYFELEDYVSWETKPEVKVDGDIEVEASILEDKAFDEYSETVLIGNYTYEVYDANTNTKLRLPDDKKFAEGLTTWKEVLEVLEKYEDDEKIDPYVRRRTTTSTLSRIYEYEFAKTSGRVLVVEVKKASRKQASTITLEGAKLLVDRTIPEGTFDMAVRTLGDKWNGWGSWYKDLYVDLITPNTEDIEQSKNAKYTATFTLDSVNYTVDGVTLQADVAPYAKDGRIMVPVRYVAQGLGVNPDDVLFSNKTVTIMNGNRIVQLVLGSNVMKVNGAEITMDTVAEAKDGRIFVPMGWIAKGLGVPVQWDNTTKTATFN